LRIPAIGVAVSLSTLGLNPDQTVEVPTDFAGSTQPSVVAGLGVVSGGQCAR